MRAAAGEHLDGFGLACGNLPPQHRGCILHRFLLAWAFSSEGVELPLGPSGSQALGWSAARSSSMVLS